MTLRNLVIGLKARYSPHATPNPKRCSRRVLGFSEVLVYFLVMKSSQWK